MLVQKKMYVHDLLNEFKFKFIYYLLYARLSYTFTNT